MTADASCAAPTVETERLILRGWRADDFEDHARICADPETMRFIGDGHTYDRREAWRVLAQLLGHWGLRGYGLWAAEEKAGGRMIGRIGLYCPEGWPGLEVGWLLDRSLWGRGLATEGARAALGWAFDELAADRVISLINVGNDASVRVAEKLGETYQETIDLHGIEAMLYAIERPR